MNRRQFNIGSIAALTALLNRPERVPASARGLANLTNQGDSALTGRPPEAERRFISEAVEETLANVKRQIRNPQLASLFENCYPNTLDTTVTYSEEGGQPDTFVITGDIHAMWLRDSTAQVMVYCPLAAKDRKLRSLVQGLIYRQAKCILLDSYANAFYRTKKLGEFASDRTEMRPGVHERKWEIDSLCYPIRLAYLYWKTTGDGSALRGEWHRAAKRIIATFREQQRLEGNGPYRFQRQTTMFYDNSPNKGVGNPTRKVGLLHSAFRPSDDACLFPFLIPSNLFALVSLGQLNEIAKSELEDDVLADDCAKLVDHIGGALEKHATVKHPSYGDIYAYEADGFGNVVLMDDANVPSLLSMPYLGCCSKEDGRYKRTRAFVLSEDNPFFFRGVAEGVGGPHAGPGMIWPLSIITRALTSSDEGEIEYCVRMLLDTTGGTGFMHESFDAKNPATFTRAWFAWCNSLFGELVVNVAASHPAVLERI